MNVTVLCGLAVNDSPIPGEMFGNLKIRWCQNPIFFSDSVVKYINYETGAFEFNDNIATLIQSFDDLKLSYVFKFNSVQFLLMCWKKDSNKIIKNNLILSQYYPYHLMKINEKNAEIPVCTNEINYFEFNQIHVKWDKLFFIQFMRKRACVEENIHSRKCLIKSGRKKKNNLEKNIQGKEIIKNKVLSYRQSL